MTDDIHDQRDTRNQYGDRALRRHELTEQPVELFAQWLEQARSADLYDYNAMSLATADAAAQPSVRMVLLKHFDQQGFCWYTDRDSRKGQDLALNPQAALLFFWPQLHRQIRIEGSVERLSEAESNSYFDQRPAASRLSAAVSMQSRVVADRATLEQAVDTMREELGERSAARPERWGGFRLRPKALEFWQGRDDRLHDRFRYQRQDSTWIIDRLCP